jgi:hypothetical protein
MTTNDLNHEEARLSKVIRPQLAPIGRHFDQWISASSPKWQRIAAVQLERYFSIETGFRHDLDELVDIWINSKIQILTITDAIIRPDKNEREGLIGFVYFLDRGEGPVLYHCYLHPFYRHSGRMQKAWSELQSVFPKFEIEEPISLAMKSFLFKVDRACISNYNKFNWPNP